MAYQPKDPILLPNRPGLSDWARKVLSQPERDYYWGPDHLYQPDPRGAAESNATWEESNGRAACNRMLDDPNWGKFPGK